MKRLLSDIQKSGIIVYTSLFLQKFKQHTIEQLKKMPKKEAFISFSEIVSIKTIDIDNWVQIQLLNGDVFYEDKSINKLIQIAEKNNHLFQKVSGGFALNCEMLKYSTDFKIIELINGDVFIVKRRYRAQLKAALLYIWEE